jgi:hypothetical protein
MSNRGIDNNGDGPSGPTGAELPAFSDRAAWYSDPYKPSRERWWDGRRWTTIVREDGVVVDAGRAAAAGRPAATAVASAADFDRNAAGKRDGRRRPAGFATLADQSLRLQRTGATYARRYELTTGRGRVGSIALNPRGQLARMSCAEGCWHLLRRRRQGDELAIETCAGEHVGWYVGRHWRPGGTIWLADDTRVDFRRSVRGWKLVTRDSHSIVADIRGHGPDARTIRLGPPPKDVASLSPIVLTACAVVMLDQVMPVPRAAG